MGKTKERRSRARKIIQFAALAFLLLCAVGGIAAIQCFLGEGGLFGYSARLVMSSSMEKDPETDPYGNSIRDIPVRSLIVIKLVPTEYEAQFHFYSEIREGDVLTFDYSVLDGTVAITHRVQHVERNGDVFTFTLSGDNGNDAAAQVIDTSANGSDRIIGKVVYCSYALGVTVCLLRDPLFLFGLCAAVLFACLLRTLLRSKRTASRAPKSLRIGGKNEK